MNGRLPYCAALGVCLWLTAHGRDANAQNNTWTGPTNGRWEEAANWSLGLAPASGQSILINSAIPRTVVMDSLTATNSPALTVNNLLVGAFGSADTLVIGMGSTTNRLRVTGTATITFGGTVLISNSTLQVDASPAGGLFIAGGALTITNATLATTNADTFIDGALGLGSLSLRSGAWLARNANVGHQSQGTLTVAGGTNTVSGALLVGRLNGSLGTVWITGGSLSVLAGITGLGVGGSGQMILSNGSVTATTMIAGGFPGVNGSLTQAGGNLLVGFGSLSGVTGAQGTYLATGGTATFNKLILGTANCGGSGTVVVNGGQVNITESGGAGVLIINNGTFTVNSGTVVIEYLVMNNPCGRFIQNGGTVTVASLQLDPNLSATGDGLPNGWKQANGLDPLSTNGVNGVNGDPDGDGFSNWQEYLAGTSPTNAASRLQITGTVRTNHDILVTWTTGGGRTNVVQATSELTGSYTNLSPNLIIAGSGETTTNYLDTGGATNGAARFYRIHLVP